MLDRIIKNGLLPKDPGGWESIHEKLIDDKSRDNLIDTATRVLATFVFDCNPKMQLETTLIHELSKYTDNISTLVVLVFKTAKMYSACLHDRYLLDGLYGFGVNENIPMKYSPADYFFDERKSSLVLDINGELKSAHKALVHKQIESLLSSNIDTTEVNKSLDINNIPDNINSNDADELIKQWENNFGKNTSN